MTTTPTPTVPPAGTVLYTTEEAGAVAPNLTRPLPADGSAPPLVLHAHGAAYQLSLIVHHRTRAGGYADV